MKIVMLGSGSYKSSLTYFRLVALGQQLANLGWEVSLIVPSADKYNDFTPDRKASLTDIELVQPWHPATGSPMLNLIPYIFTSAVALLRRRSNIVYLYKPTPVTIIGLLPKLLFRTPIILDLDDLGSEVMRLEKQSKLQVKLVAFCERTALRYATAVVVASSYLENLVISAYPNKPILVLSNGVNPVEFKLAKPKKPRKAVYYFGALNRVNLIETFLRSLPAVLADIPDTQVTIIGGGSAINEIKNLADELGILGAVSFTGWIDPNDINDYVRFADIAVCMQPDIPTVRAASNLKVFQYMALGSVPVVSDVGDLPYYVAGNSSGPAGIAVPAGNIKQLSKTLLDLLTNIDERSRMAQIARHQAETSYSWDTLANKLDGFMSDFTSKPIASPNEELSK